jgi:predicted nucleic acid-binding Zn ribbon protein
MPSGQVEYLLLCSPAMVMCGTRSKMVVQDWSNLRKRWSVVTSGARCTPLAESKRWPLRFHGLTRASHAPIHKGQEVTGGTVLSRKNTRAIQSSMKKRHCPVCGFALSFSYVTRATPTFPVRCLQCGSFLAPRPSPADRLLFAILYNVVFFGGLLLGGVLRSWVPVLTLCPTALFLLPRILAWRGALTVLDKEQIRHNRVRAAVLVLAFVIITILVGVIRG